MSRVGYKPIPIPAGVQIALPPGRVEATGPKGSLAVALPGGIRFQQEKTTLTAARDGDHLAALHGLARSLVANAVRGVSLGFQKELDIVGVGYRAELKGKQALVLSLGFSHQIEYPIPPTIAIAVDAKQTHLIVSGADRQQVGQVAAELRRLRPPDPYKNKGVRYTGERLKKKEGKTGAK
ncbi:MAG: 50S ribosomal protein L6 [Terriglobales bacterium]